MGGYTNLELMESFPEKIALAIFVSAAGTPSGVSYAGSTLSNLMFKDTLLGEATRLTFADGPDKPATSMVVADSNVAEVFYTGCAPEDIELASILRKPFPVQITGTAVSYTDERLGRVTSVYVRSARDNALPPRAQDFVVENCGPFVEVVEFDAGHFSPWSHADEFAKLALDLADKYDVAETL